jgi:hypothetical protein
VQLALVALAVAGTGGLADLGLHQFLPQPDHGLAQHIGVLIASTLPASSPTLILPTSVIAVLLSLDPKHRRF